MTSFLNALQNLAVTTTAPIQPEQPKITDPDVTIELVTNRNRIDVFFSFKPKQSVLDTLKANSFRYRPTDHGWYTYDNRIQREFLAREFNMPELLDASPHNETVTPEPLALSPISNESINLPTESPEYARFKQQTNELLAHTKMDAADLMLLAIDSLHKQLFSKH